MTNQIKYYSLNSLPSTAESGAIYYLSNGSQFIGTSSNTFLPISDFIFVNELPPYGVVDKVYVHKENDKTSLKVWRGTSFELLSGEEYDDTSIQQAITALQNKINELENNEVDLTPLRNDITSLTTKTNEIESELASKGNVKSVNGNTPDVNGNVSIQIDSVTPYDDTELRGKVVVNEGKISTLETKVADLESASSDITQLETQVNTNVNNINDLSIQISPIPSQILDLDTRLAELETEKKTSTIVISTNDMTIGIKPSVVNVPYSSSITSVKAILSNDSGTSVEYSIEKSTNGISWLNVISDNVAVGTIISNATASAILTKNELLRLVVNSNNEDVNGLTVNITIEEQ